MVLDYYISRARFVVGIGYGFDFQFRILIHKTFIKIKIKRCVSKVGFLEKFSRFFFLKYFFLKKIQKKKSTREGMMGG